VSELDVVSSSLAFVHHRVITSSSGRLARATASRMFRDDDDDGERAREAAVMRQRAYLAELDAQLAHKRELARRDAVFGDAAPHIHRSHEFQYRAASASLYSDDGENRRWEKTRELASSRSVAPRGMVRENDDDGGAEAAERERRREKAQLREALERQIEAKRLERERERAARARAEEEEERRLREEQAELTRRFERRRRFGLADGLADDLHDASLSASEGGSGASGATNVMNAASNGDAFEFIKVESTFVELSRDDEESDADEKSKPPEVIHSPPPRQLTVVETVMTEPAKPSPANKTEDESDDDEPLLRQGSVKAMAKMWDTPVKSKRDP
jgi:hypothetical protein